MSLLDRNVRDFPVVFYHEEKAISIRYASVLYFLEWQTRVLDPTSQLTSDLECLLRRWDLGFLPGNLGLNASEFELVTKLLAQIPVYLINTPDPEDVLYAHLFRDTYDKCPCVFIPTTIEHREGDLRRIVYTPVNSPMYGPVPTQMPDFAQLSI